MLEGCNDARTGIPPGIPEGAMCVQRFDDSLNSAIHITYRISLRSSSMPEPRDPLLKVFVYSSRLRQHITRVGRSSGRLQSPDRHCRSNKVGIQRVGDIPIKGMFSVMILPQVHLRNGFFYLRVEGKIEVRRFSVPLSDQSEASLADFY